MIIKSGMTEQSTISCHLHYVARQNGFSRINIRVSGQASWSRAFVNFTQLLSTNMIGTKLKVMRTTEYEFWPQRLDLSGGKRDSNNLDVRI